MSDKGTMTLIVIPKGAFGPAEWYPEAGALTIKRSFGGRDFKKVSSEKVEGTRRTVYRTPDGDNVELLENPKNDAKYCRMEHQTKIIYYDINGSYKPLVKRFPGHDHSPL